MNRLYYLFILMWMGFHHETLSQDMFSVRPDSAQLLIPKVNFAPAIDFALPGVCCLVNHCLALEHDKENRQKVFFNYECKLKNATWKWGINLVMNPQQSVRVRIARAL